MAKFHAPTLALSALALIGGTFLQAHAASTHHWTVVYMKGTKPITFARSVTRERATEAVTVPVDTVTTVAAWTLLDEATCTQGPTGTWSLPAKNPNPKGVWSSTIITGTLSNGDCPGMDFQFNAIQFDWTRAKSPAGAMDRKFAIWRDTDDGENFAILEGMSVTLQ
jgi:hypothetical protein